MVGLASSFPFKSPATMAVPMERRICSGRLGGFGRVCDKFAP